MKNIHLHLIFLIFILATINSITPASAGFENCIYCHGYAFAKFNLNLTSFNDSNHGRINNTNDLNYACYACHWNGTPPKQHPTDRTKIKSCEDCHTASLFNAPFVSAHFQNSTSIQVNVSCISCHNNSVDVNAGYNRTTDRVSHFGTNKYLMSPIIRSTNCTWCHYDNTGSTWGFPKDPRISASFSHAPYLFNLQCYGCHSGGKSPITFHDNSMGKWKGNRNCISCHDKDGPAPKRVDFTAANDSGSIHKNLNENAVTNLSNDNLRCWACHGDGDGSESAQPEGGHPLNYKNPKNCNNNDCHSISQSLYQEPMLYSHFKNASWNNNPNNITNYNLTVSVQCENCHENSLVRSDGNSDLAKVSHYGSTDNLLDSFNCIYCHVNKDNSEDWGNATLINKDRTSLIEFEKEKNKFTLFEGDSIYLGEGYDLKLVEISNKRDNAFIQILKDNEKVDEVLLARGSPYYYEQNITIDNSTFKTPVLIVNITSIFKGEKSGFIQFEGSRVRKVHTEKESKNSACYACHLIRFSDDKERYRVIDREKDENPEKDMIYYSKVLIDFNSTNKNKIYFNDEDYVFSQIDTDFGKFFPSSSLQKKLIEGETWNISEGYSLRINEISTDRKNIWLTLLINKSVVEDTIVGTDFTYEPGIRYKDNSKTNLSIFSTKISSIFLGNPNFILINDVAAISPDILKTTANATLFGYNSSWFKINDTFTVGKIPRGFHGPNLYTDQRNWADCVKCHDSSHNLRISSIDAISSRLGKHSGLNYNASNKSVISDPIDKACWACHTDGKEPITHSPTNNLPRNCKSCHIIQETPSFEAMNISEEPHAAENNCESCHFIKSHILKRFAVSPVIKEAYLSEKTNITQNQTVRLVAEAIAGYKMKIRVVEFFIDEKGLPGKGIPMAPFFGKNDSQTRAVEAYINTSNISIGSHVIYIHAMERNNRWGDYYSLSLNVTATLDSTLDSTRTNKESPGLVIGSFLIGLMVAYFMISHRSKIR